MIVKMALSRFFSTTEVAFKKAVASNLKGKKHSSQLWINRQLSDPYVEKAKMLNYRCRSAFKLIEIDDRFRVLSPGQTVIDCGAAPGSWSQVAVSRCKPGTVIAIDQQSIYPIEGAIILDNSDFTLPETRASIRKILQDSKVDVVLSDMAPSATGVREMDNRNMLTLCYTVLRFAVQVSKPKGVLVVKLWQCGESQSLTNDMLRFYDSVKVVKPNSSRADSAEIFLLARNFKGLEDG